VWKVCLAHRSANDAAYGRCYGGVCTFVDRVVCIAAKAVSYG